MKPENLAKRYPNCARIGILGTQQQCKAILEQQLRTALAAVVPLPHNPPIHHALELSTGSRENSGKKNMGKWGYWNPVTDRWVFLTPLSFDVAYPELYHPGTTIYTLVRACEADLQKLVYRRQSHPYAARAPIIPPIQPMGLVWASTGVHPAQAQTQASAPVNASVYPAVTLSVYLNNCEIRNSETVVPNNAGRIRLNEHKVALGRIGMEVGNSFEWYNAQSRTWISVSWSSDIPASGGKRLFFRKVGVTVMANFDIETLL
ncbi:hypothetical protein V5O48_013157 [Marasmius crinis-equi]|uniref:Uncharacterized protein n=1 Tax=Marasmius crinis-equi TaxID=585013 RepID=A0ABR3F112_9AGAR